MEKVSVPSRGVGYLNRLCLRRKNVAQIRFRPLSEIKESELYLVRGDR